VPIADIGHYRNEMTSLLSSAATSARSGGPQRQHRAVLLVSTSAWALVRDQIVTSLTWHDAENFSPPLFFQLGQGALKDFLRTFEDRQ